MRSIKEAAIAFDRACTAARVPYALVGGFAVMAWGIPRATMDVDAMVHIGQARVSALAAACKAEDFLVDERDLDDVLKEGGHATISDRHSPYHIDLKAARTREEQAQVAAASEVSYPNGKLRIARPEDTIAYKLLFGSSQDLADARGVLVRQQSTLDWTRLLVLCRRLGVEPKLEETLRASGITVPK